MNAKVPSTRRTGSSFVALAIVGIFVLGCNKPPSIEGCSEPRTVWQEFGAQNVDSQSISCGFCYWADNDGRSVAFVIPVQGPNTPRPSASVVRFAPEDGLLYFDDDPLVPPPHWDNRCFVVGRDLAFHDTGYSADWLLWTVSPRSGDPDRSVGTGGLFVFSEEARQQQGAFWRAVADHAFVTSLQFEAPVNRPRSSSRGRASIVLKYLEDRPLSWTSANPRDIWEDLVQRDGPVIPSPEAVSKENPRDVGGPP